MIKTIIKAFPEKKRIPPEDETTVIRIAEMFADTIQGENFVGVPATFLRLQGCTLNCVWCDTSEVWRKGNPYTVKELLNICETNNLINKWKNGQHLVLTGGSPLLQQKALIEFVQMIKEKYKFKPFIEIENECVIMPSSQMIEYVNLWNNSPKLKNSGNKIIRLRPEVIKKLNKLENSWFKFVISSDDDWKEIDDVYIKPGLIDKNKIVLMPEGINRNELQKHYNIVIETAVRENIRMTDRLHITIWNKKTGV